MQVAALLQAARGTRYAPLLALLYTGLRRGETLALQWSDVDLERHTLRVRGTLSRVDAALVATAPKTAKSTRFVPHRQPRWGSAPRSARPGGRAAAGRHGLA